MLKQAILLIILSLGFIGNLEAGTDKTVILATTTSVQNTGLLDILVDIYQKKTGYTVKAVALGSGQALKLASNGEADILWVHDPQEEQKFMDKGYGAERVTFMHNDFVILGPKNDPAGVMGAEKAAQAFKKIAASKALFISRGDNSGTHGKEIQLWKEAGAFPEREVYIEAGQGMSQSLRLANEKQAYILTDRATYLTLRKSIDLVIVCEGDASLINPYSLILVNQHRFPKVNAQGAKTLFNFLLSEEAKDIVEEFNKEKFGRKVFFWDYYSKYRLIQPLYGSYYRRR